MIDSIASCRGFQPSSRRMRLASPTSTGGSPARRSPNVTGTGLPVTLLAHTLMWVATVVTLITGAQYWEQTRKALSAQ